MRTSANKLIATVFGAVYLLVGLLGFFATGGRDLVIFAVNPLPNVIHVAIGAALLLAGLKSVPAARSVNTVVGGVYLVVGVVGLFLLNSALNIALNGADNVLHLASAVLLVGVGLSQEKDTTARAYARGR